MDTLAKKRPARETGQTRYKSYTTKSLESILSIIEHLSAQCSRVVSAA